MPRLIVSLQAGRDLVRLEQYLAKRDRDASRRAVQAIVRRLEQLSANAAIGRPVEGEPNLRELIIKFGSSGYVALYEFDEIADLVIIAAIRHQREAGYSTIF